MLNKEVLLEVKNLITDFKTEDEYIRAVNDVSFTSPLANFFAKGKFQYDKIGPSLLQYVDKYYNVTDTVIQHIPEQELAFNGHIKKSEIITNINGFKTVVYYRGSSIRKITREFIGSSFSSTTIYYILNDKLIHNIYASLRSPNVYYEEHMYFNNGEMYKWENSKDKEINPFKDAFLEKEKLALNFFEVDLKEAKTKKAVR